MRWRIVVGGLVVGIAVAGAIGVMAAGWLNGRPLAPRASASASAERSVAERPQGRVSDHTPPGSPGEADGGDVGAGVRDAAADAADASVAAYVPRREAVHRDTPALDDTDNYLVVGIDRPPGRTRGGRADTIVVVVFDPESDHVGFVSVPRDLYLEIPGYGTARIGAAPSVARKQDADELALLRDLVEEVLALEIESSVLVDLATFERTIDLLDGIEVEVPCPIRDNFIDPRTDSGRRVLDVPAGVVHMDGKTAAMYVRSRHGRSDWSRARRQQAVLVALRGELASLSSLSRVPDLMDEVDSSVVTDLSRLEMLALARRAMRIEPEHMHGIVLGYGEVQPWRTPEGAHVLRADYPAIDGAVSELFSAPSPGTRPTRGECPAKDVALEQAWSGRTERE